MYNHLTKEEKEVILDKMTEAPYKNEYDDLFVDGVYICRQCNAPLFSSKAKFDSGCGWPSFDVEYPNSIKRETDADGSRTEILCNKCGGHLGHVFEGENITDKNTRHCVNSTSIRFIPQKAKSNAEVSYLGGGCFWCTEAVYQRLKGITKATPGYSGGHIHNPTYQQVSDGDTGHAEVIKVEYDSSVVTFEMILEVFFATHDPTTLNAQGNDYGEQYRSVIFYTTLDQKTQAEEFVKKLTNDKKFGKPIVTRIEPFVRFYEAENYHKNYFEKNPNQPYCQVIIVPKVEKLEKLGVALK